jgi:CheY-like chemotaxis protein
VPAHVFVSYSRADQTYVRDLAQFLAGSDISVWYDYDIASAERFDIAIREQIDTCSAFIVIMTPESDASDWVAREIARAEAKKKAIYPVLLRGEVFFRFGHLQYDDVTGGTMPGASFVLRLRDQVRVTATGGQGARRLSGLRLLWIDDNPINNESVIDHLIARGAQVRTATDVQQALALLPYFGPTAIVSDVFRAGAESGFDDLQLIRQTSDSTPCLFFTGHLTNDLKEKAAYAGAAAITASMGAVVEWLETLTQGS